MNKITEDDVNMLFWHACSKMRQGSFVSARQFFRYVMEVSPTFQAGLAQSYCAMRAGDLEQARIDLLQIAPSNPREERLYARLRKRVGL